MKLLSQTLLLLLIFSQVLLFQNCQRPDSGSSGSASVMASIPDGDILPLQAIQGKRYVLVAFFDAGGNNQNKKPYIYEISPQLEANQLPDGISGPTIALLEPPVDCNSRNKICSQKDNGEFECQNLSTAMACSYVYDINDYYFFPSQFAALISKHDSHQIMILNLSDRSYAYLQELQPDESVPSVTAPSLIPPPGSAGAPPPPMIPPPPPPPLISWIIQQTTKANVIIQIQIQD